MGGLFKTKTIRNEGNKLASFQVNSATYGTIVPVIFGTTRISGNIIDYYDFTAIAHTTTQRSGKGGGTKIKNTTYTYTVACLLGLCEGPIAGIGRVWKDKETFDSLPAAGLTDFGGVHGQSPWWYTQSKHPERSLPYSGLAYVAGVLDLGDSAGLPNMNFEVKGQLVGTGDGIDANPADVINYIIFDAVNGVGFGAGGIDSDGLNRLRMFCYASDLLISSPPDGDTKKAYEIINDICKATNTIGFWSQNRLKLVPLCDETLTRNGVTFTPNTTPEYDLDENDFLPMDDGKLVIFERGDNSEAFNQATVEFINRANSYEVETVDYQILTDINNRGLRPADSETIHYLHTKPRAQYVAGMLAMKSLYGRSKYIFRLDESFSLLEPGDLVTLTESTNGLVKKPVIIERVQETGENEWEFTAVGKPPGMYSPGRYTVGEADRPSVNYQVDPGNVNPPVIFEPPANLENAMTIYVGASGGVNWGGCNIWVSDNGNTYQQVGEIENPSRQGVLSAALPYAADPDITNTLSVDMSMSHGELLSGTRADADNYNTLCYVGGELVSYETATLTAAGKYDLAYLRRGVYSTENKHHGPSEQFMRIDRQAIFSYPITEDQIGKTIYLKFTSRNVFGIAEQDLDEVQVYSYTIKGTAVTSPLANVTDLRNYYENGNMFLLWSPITDFRSPIEYEIRKGSSWHSAEILGHTFEAKFQVVGNGTYWIAAAYKNVYSYEPEQIIITGARYVKNVLAAFDEKVTGWTGTVSGSAAVFDNEIRLMGTTEFDSIPDVDAVWNLNYYGFDASQGVYHIPSAHKVDIGEAALCNVSVNYTAYGDTIFDTFDGIEDVDALANWDGNYGPYVGFKVQINIDDAGWQDFYPGQYFGRTFDLRAIIENYSPEITAALSGFSFAVDAPDIFESKNVSVPTGGMSILYDAYFHAVPEPQITIFDAQEGDQVKLSFQGITGFTIQIVNSGAGVEREINYMVQKY
jgi:hypothetical protein